ncbi:unnamed protein product [Dracunculus medinensis]|uniref:Uncharacterized protein n=1 Tax=Dracunculus medinensis TaxID=318479 RepID=A0A0N4UFR9_DRAME|nr:unnamed protein product [Dracunculus medinensis]
MEETFTTQISNSSHILATKRQLLQYVASIYDPLGYTGLIVLHLQYLWRQNVKWDDQLESELQQPINNIFTDWETIIFPG